MSKNLPSGVGHLRADPCTPFLPLLIAILVGCATAPKGAIVVDDPHDVPSLQQQMAGQLGKLAIGMSLEDFMSAVPDAYVAGQKLDTTAYEVARSTKYVTQDDLDRQNLVWGAGKPRAKSKREVLWFYFYTGRLVQWGAPDAWPDKPDVILEMRTR